MPAGSALDHRIRLAGVRNQAYNANDDILDTLGNGAVSPKTGDSWFWIQVAVDTGGGVLSYTGPAGANKVELNSGTPLDADKAYGFPMAVFDGVDYDFQYTVSGTILEFSVTELVSFRG